MNRRERVLDYTVSPEDKPVDIAERMLTSGGFVARKFAEAVETLAGMWNDADVRIMLSFPAAIVATGVRGVLAQLLRDRLVDLVITTCGTLDHDIARSFAHYYEGEFTLDDERIEKEGYHRLGSVLVPRDSYGPLIEEKMLTWLEEAYSVGVRKFSTKELAWLIGEKIGMKDSILYWAHENEIPIVIPGPMDGAVGSQVWLFSQRRRDFQLDVLGDEQLLSDFVFESKKLGALMLGGGISKHHTIWWAQFKGGLDYAVYVTTAVEYDGSLSGAPIREAVSWGKVKPRARKVTVYGDATMILPFMISAALGLSHPPRMSQIKEHEDDG